MKPNERKPRYHAFLLRCWESRPSDEGTASAWRFSLEDPHTGRRRNFAELDLLVAALQTDLAGEGEVEENDASAGARGDAEKESFPAGREQGP